MSQDQNSFAKYLKMTPPSEIAKTLDSVLFDLVASAEFMQSYDSLYQKYVDVLLLRDEFAMMDENLREIWK